MAKEEVGVCITSLRVRSARHFQGRGSPEGEWTLCVRVAGQMCTHMPFLGEQAGEAS